MHEDLSIPTAAMTRSERLRWWALHGATIDGTADEKFAMDLQKRGIIRLHDTYANASYWAFTNSGADLYFGRTERPHQTPKRPRIAPRPRDGG